MLVKDFMRPNVFNVGPQATLFEVAEKMLEHQVETLLVFENEHLLGVIGLRDLFTAPIPAHYGNVMPHRDNEAQFLDVWKTMLVCDLMNENVLSVRDDTPLLRALELMVNSGKHPLAVMRAEKVIGMISRMDVVRALVAKWRNSA